MEKGETMPSSIHNNLEQQIMYNCKTIRQINAPFLLLEQIWKTSESIKRKFFNLPCLLAEYPHEYPDQFKFHQNIQIFTSFL